MLLGNGRRRTWSSNSRWSVSHQWDLHRPRDENFTRHHKDQPQASLKSILIALCIAAGGTVHVCVTPDGTAAWWRRDPEPVNNAEFRSYVFYGVIDPSVSEEPEDGYFTASESFSDSVDSDDELLESFEKVGDRQDYEQMAKSRENEPDEHRNPVGTTWTGSTCARCTRRSVCCMLDGITLLRGGGL